MYVANAVSRLGTFIDDRIVDPVSSSIGKMDARRKVLTLLVTTIIIYGPAIAYFLSNTSIQYDYDIYRERTQTIIDGGLLYRDVHTETPPLINFILVPAQLLGGGDSAYVWGAYEAAFAFLLACLLYFATRRWDETRAFYLGTMALLCPFLLIESATGEDGAIVAFVFFAGAVSMLHGKRYAPVAIALGVWTKMWPVLLLPIELMRAKGCKRRTEVIVLAAIITLVITLPFLVLCFDEFVEFLSFYFLNDPSRPSGGRSMWNFLRDGGYGVPSMIELTLVLGALLATYLYSNHRGWSTWKSITFTMLVFILFYPKMHIGYYVMPFVLLSAWAVSDWRMTVRLFAAYIPITFSGGFASDNPDPILASSDGGWLAGLLLVLIGVLLICDAARIAFRSEPFMVSCEKRLDQGTI